MPSEFDLINTYFNWQQPSRTVVHSIGDDAAVLNVPTIPANQQLVVTTDTLISGVHFPEQTPAHAIGHKSLAVNLSDLAAMGADPAWFTLALTLPEQNPQWLTDFSAGLKALAESVDIQLVGGDTTKGTLTISITAMGLVTPDRLLLRSGAKNGDILYVTGTLGDAATGLSCLQKKITLPSAKDCIQRLNYPQARIHESTFIRKYAHACLDISDGLLADLSHILDASHVGAHLDLDQIPFSESLQALDKEQALAFALNGGDDYELLFTIPPEQQQAFEREMKKNRIKVQAIGKMDASLTGIVSASGTKLIPRGYLHFSASRG